MVYCVILLCSCFESFSYSCYYHISSLPIVKNFAPNCAEKNKKLPSYTFIKQAKSSAKPSTALQNYHSYSYLSSSNQHNMSSHSGAALRGHAIRVDSRHDSTVSKFA